MMNLTSVDLNLIAWRYCDQLSSARRNTCLLYPGFGPLVFFVCYLIVFFAGSNKIETPSPNTDDVHPLQRCVRQSTNGLVTG